MGIPEEKDIGPRMEERDDYKVSAILEAGKSFQDSGCLGESHVRADNSR